MVKKAQDKQKVKQPFVDRWEKHYSTFEFLYLFVTHFCMIKCSYDVIDLSIVVIYDVQYVAATYGSKVNWISIFANYKWVACVLNALVFTFLGICFKKKCGFVNLLLKVNTYVFSSRFKEFKNLENDIFSFF